MWAPTDEFRADLRGNFECLFDVCANHDCPCNCHCVAQSEKGYTCESISTFFCDLVETARQCHRCHQVSPTRAIASTLSKNPGRLETRRGCAWIVAPASASSRRE